MPPAAWDWRTGGPAATLLSAVPSERRLLGVLYSGQRGAVRCGRQVLAAVPENVLEGAEEKLLAEAQSLTAVRHIYIYT